MNLVVVTRDPDQKNKKIRVRGERGRHTRTHPRRPGSASTFLPPLSDASDDVSFFPPPSDADDDCDDDIDED